MSGDAMSYNLPDEKGYFGEFGGRFAPEILIPVLDELDTAYRAQRDDPEFRRWLDDALCSFAGRPTPLFFAERLTKREGGAKIYLKREDLAHTGAYKINNALGQVLLAKLMGKTRVIAETAAGQHGIATATACTLFGLECWVYMGTVDVERQSTNVREMELLGTRVISVDSGSGTLKDAMDATLQDWEANAANTHYCMGSVVGPHPYPMMVRNFQSVIGSETRQQILELEGRLPDLLVACIGCGGNAMGLFYPFLDDENVQMVGVEAGGLGLDTVQHGATLCSGRPGVLHGSRSYALQDEEGRIVPSHSVSAGLDYPGVGPELAYLKDAGRITCTSTMDTEALDAFNTLAHTEGILSALEPAHAIAYVLKTAPDLSKEGIIVVNLSGRGDKDLQIVEGAIHEGTIKGPASAQGGSL
jgi:tryptophan synthase beta chain